jgi:hypothetical protein
MGPQHRCADPVRVVTVGTRFGIERQKRGLPSLPACNVFGERLVDALAKAGADKQRGFLGAPPESQRQDETAVAGQQVDLSGQRDIAVARVVVVPAQFEVPDEILPAV